MYACSAGDRKQAQSSRDMLLPSLVAGRSEVQLNGLIHTREALRRIGIAPFPRAAAAANSMDG
jgi:hypothetical protein